MSKEKKPKYPTPKVNTTLKHGLTIITIAGFLVSLWMYLTLEPWTPKLGVPFSPLRYWYTNVIAVIFYVPLTVRLHYWVYEKRNHWLAFRGRFIPGTTYSMFSRKRIVAMALTAALFAGASLIQATTVDLAAAPAFVGVFLFDPLIGFWTLFLGDTIGQGILVPIAGGDPISMLGWFFQDGTAWVVFGIIWRLFEESRYGKSVFTRDAFMILTYVPLRTLFEVLPPHSLWNPWLAGSPFWVHVTWYYAAWTPTTVVAMIGGLLISEAVLKEIVRPRQG